MKIHLLLLLFRNKHRHYEGIVCVPGAHWYVQQLNSFFDLMEKVKIAPQRFYLSTPAVLQITSSLFNQFTRYIRSWPHGPKRGSS